MVNLSFGRWFVILSVIFFTSSVLHGAIECSYTYCPGEEEWTCYDYPEEPECELEREEQKMPKPNIRV